MTSEWETPLIQIITQLELVISLFRFSPYGNNLDGPFLLENNKPDYNRDSVAIR